MHYLRFHFGTDLLVANWLMVISSLVFVVVPIFYFVYGADSNASSLVNYVTMLVSGILVTSGSIVLLHMSYDPNAFLRLMVEMSRMDVSKMTFMEHYFTCSNLLIVSWLFFVSTLILIIYPVFALCIGEMSGMWAALYILGVVVMIIPTYLWVVALFPSNVVKNEGRGSSYFHDFCCCSCCKPSVDKLMQFCFGIESFVDTYAGVDFIAMTWCLFLISVLGLISAIVFVAYAPTDPIAYLWLVASILFCLGAFLFGHAIYPENTHSNMTWRFCSRFICFCCGSDYPKNDDNCENPLSSQAVDETTSLVQHARMKKKNSDPDVGDRS